MSLGGERTDMPPSYRRPAPSRIVGCVRRYAPTAALLVVAAVVIAFAALPRYQEHCIRPIAENERVLEWIDRLHAKEPELAARFCNEVVSYPLSGPVWPHAHTDEILASISDVVEFAKSNKMKLWPSGGVLIGAVRHGGYWDDDDIDLDLYVDSSSEAEVRNKGLALIEFLKGRDTVCRLHQCDHCHVDWSIIKCEKKITTPEGKPAEVLMDINLYMRGKDDATVWGPYGGTFPRSTLFPLRPCRLHSLTLDCPHSVKGYMDIFNEAEYAGASLLQADPWYGWKYPRIDEQMVYNVRLLHACGYASLMQYLDPLKDA